MGDRIHYVSRQKKIILYDTKSKYISVYDVTRRLVVGEHKVPPN